ncbi:MAG: nitroreductase family protein [Planctomycetota bacterium]
METFDAIRARRTLKVLADPAQPFPECDDALAPTLAGIVEVAGWAPFHYQADAVHRAGTLDSGVPWRFYALAGSACQRLIQWFDAEQMTAGKVRHMLAAARACVLATWLPDPGPDDAFQAFEPSLRNMEHIAAASAASQNLLLAATDQGFETYWSSGGLFRTEQAYDRLGIPPREVLLGALFLFPTDVQGVPAKPGAHRDARGPAESWSRWVEP